MIKLSFECIDRFFEAFGEDAVDDFGYDVGLDGGISFSIGDDLWNQPCDETEESFLDRIERSKVAGRNLFLDEWQKAPPWSPNSII